MSLDVNTKVQSIDIRKLPSTKAKLTKSLAGLLTTVMLFSGGVIGAEEVKAEEISDNVSYHQTYDEIDQSTIIEIPEVYQYNVADACGKEIGDAITIGDLKGINSSYLTVSIEDDSSLEWLNYLGEVEYLSLIVKTDNTEKLREIKELNGINTLSITTFNNLELNETDFKFLKESDSIKKLSLYGFIPEPGLLENLTYLKQLNLGTDGNYKVDFTKLTFLDVLSFPTAGPYDVAIDLTSDEYYALVENDVEITFDNPEELAQYIKIDDKLNDIVASLGVDKNSSDQEKLDAILIYVLDNLTYDSKVYEAQQASVEHSELTNSFYEGGMLYGALEKETAICGNYTALTNALAERLGLNAYYLKSTNHAWSLVEVEGKQYYVDSTWLDDQTQLVEGEVKEVKDETGFVISSSTSYETVEASELIKRKETDGLDWYMENPNDYPMSETQKESHEALNLPSFYKITAEEGKVETSVVTDIEDKKEKEATIESTPEEATIIDDNNYEVKVGDRKWIIGGATAVGIMAAFGGAVAAKKYKDKKERERRIRQQQIYDELGIDDYDTSSYDMYKPSSKKSGRSSKR